MEATGLDSSAIARILDRPPRSVSRWINEAVEPRWESKERLLELTYVIERLSQVIEPKVAEDWLFTPLRALDYAKPVDLIRTGRTRDVLAIIDAIGEGVYT
jgi:uncharacterized protein (DUF2384 family)